VIEMTHTKSFSRPAVQWRLALGMSNSVYSNFLNVVTNDMSNA